MGLRYLDQSWEDKEVISEVLNSLIHNDYEKKVLVNLWMWMRKNQFFDDFIYCGKAKEKGQYTLREILSNKQRDIILKSASDQLPHRTSTLYNVFIRIDNKIFLLQSSEQQWKNSVQIAKKKRVVIQQSIQQQIKDGEFKDFLIMESIQNGKIELQGAAATKKSSYVNKASDKLQWAYVYSIEIGGQVVYVGSTKRPIKTRLSEHIACALREQGLTNSQQGYLYQAMRENPYQFKILWKAPSWVCNLTQMEAMECGFISLLKPKFNYEGVKVEYNFTVGKDGAVFKGEQQLCE